MPSRLSLLPFLRTINMYNKYVVVNTALVETVLYAKTILSLIPLCAENSLLWIAWFCRALAKTGAAWSSFKCTTVATSPLFDSLGPPMLGISRAKFAPHWTALAVAIYRCSPKLSLRSNCNPRSFQGPFSGLCYPNNALPATDFHWSLAPGFWRLQPHTRQVRHARSRWFSFQQVGPSSENRHTWRTKQVVLPATPKQIVWNLLLYHRLDADLPSRGIKRIMYVNADQRAESRTLTSSSSCFCGGVYHSLDGVNSGPAFPESELVSWETVLPDQESLKSL